MFNASAGRVDPYFSLFFRQAIPRCGFFPNHIEAIVDLRNLLAQAYVPVLGNDGHTVYRRGPHPVAKSARRAGCLLFGVVKGWANPRLGRYNRLTIMLQTEELIQAAHRKASSELKNWSGTTGDFFQLTFFGDEGFRGVVILRAPSLDSALSLSYLLKLNPGGSVASAQLPSGLHEELLISHSERLLSQREADDLQAKLVTSAQFSFKSKA